MIIHDKTKNKIEISRKQYHILITDGAVDTNEFTLFWVAEMTTIFGIALIRVHNSLECHLCHIHIRKEE